MKSKIARAEARGRRSKRVWPMAWARIQLSCIAKAAPDPKAPDYEWVWHSKQCNYEDWHASKWMTCIANKNNLIPSRHFLQSRTRKRREFLPQSLWNPWKRLSHPLIILCEMRFDSLISCRNSPTESLLFDWGSRHDIVHCYFEHLLFLGGFRWVIYKAVVEMSCRSMPPGCWGGHDRDVYNEGLGDDHPPDCPAYSRYN